MRSQRGYVTRFEHRPYSLSIQPLRVLRKTIESDRKAFRAGADNARG